MVMILFEKGIFATAFFLLTFFFFEVLTVFSVLGRKGKGRTLEKGMIPASRISNLKRENEDRTN